jgi:hypothetical protein
MGRSGQSKRLRLVFGWEYSVSRHRGRFPYLASFRAGALGCQGVGKTLAFYGVEAGRRGKEIETVTVGVAGDDSRGAAENFDDIGVGQESFLPLAALKSIYSQRPSTEADSS